MDIGNLRDKLLQAGLVTEEEAARAEKSAKRSPKHERKPVRNPRPASERLTPEELAASKAKRDAREKKRALDRERNENRRRAKAELARATDVRRVAEALGIEFGGDETFFFQNHKGRVQRLLVSAEVRQQIAAGELAVIDHPRAHALEYAIVPREGADAVLKIDERAVRFYARGPGETYGFAEDGT